MLFKKWLTRTVKWLASPVWKWNKPKPIWFSASTRNVHSSKDNRRWSSSKTKWYAGTLTNNNSDLARFRQLKMLQKLRVTKFSNVLRLKRTNAGLKKSSKKTCAMSFTSKKVNRQLLLASEPKWKRGSALNRSCKRRKISSWDSRPNARQRSSAWKTSSNKSCSNALPRTRSLSRWMPRNAGCASRSTSVKSKDCGRRS